MSHELKTPLTSMKVLADSLNGQDRCAGGALPGIYGRISVSEIDRETKIINDLL